MFTLIGFPRSLENAKDFVEQFGMGECCLFFDCPRDVMISRILERGKVQFLILKLLMKKKKDEKVFATNTLEFR
jgi:UMP-CMP kinase